MTVAQTRVVTRGPASATLVATTFTVAFPGSALGHVRLPCFAARVHNLPLHALRPVRDHLNVLRDWSKHFSNKFARTHCPICPIRADDFWGHPMAQAASLQQRAPSRLGAPNHEHDAEPNKHQTNTSGGEARFNYRRLSRCDMIDAQKSEAADACRIARSL
jgi:hypothetical protein